MNAISDEGNGKGEPCWFRHDCQLANDQREGNKTLAEILTELRTMNTSLVEPATNVNRVPLKVFIIVVCALVGMGVLQHLAYAHQDFSGAFGNANWQIENQKKSPVHDESQR